MVESETCLRELIEAGDLLQATRLIDHQETTAKLIDVLSNEREKTNQEIRKAMDDRHTAQVRAQEKFEQSVQQRFAQVNEFRNALADLSGEMATRRELETALFTIGGRLDANTQTIGELRSRIDVGPVALHQLQTGADRLAGRQEAVSGFRLTAGTFFAGLAALAAAITLGFYVTHGSSAPTKVVCVNAAKVIVPC